MDEEGNQTEQVKHVDGVLLLITGLILAFAFLAFFNQSGLESIHLSSQRDKLSDFFDNQKIFDRYLKEKEQIYWDLNRLAWMSVGDTSSGNKYVFVDLFYNAGPWGWDEDRLESRYSFKALLYDFFIDDFDYWNSAGETRFKKNWPDDPENWSNRHLRLRQVIGNDTTISRFFHRLFDNKVSFLKSILASYNISVKDDLLANIPDSIHVIKGHSLKNFVDFLNDSTRNTFHIIDVFYIQNTLGIMPQAVHDMYNWICRKVFDTYVREKFSVYDSSFYSVRASYSAYIDKMKREEKWLASKLKKPPPSKIQPPAIPLEIEKSFFNLMVLWSYFVFAYLTKNILLYRFSLSNLNVPTIMNFLVYRFKRKNFLIGWLTLAILFGSTILIASVNIKYFHVLYGSCLYFIVFFLAPVLLMVYVCWQTVEIIFETKS